MQKKMKKEILSKVFVSKCQQVGKSVRNVKSSVRKVLESVSKVLESVREVSTLMFAA